MNIAFIDGQNLYYSLKSSGLKIDYKRFRVYLKDKYNVKGGYKRLVDYLIEKDRFERILLPTRERASSLYKIMSTKYYAYVEDVIFKFKYLN